MFHVTKELCISLTPFCFLPTFPGTKFCRLHDKQHAWEQQKQSGEGGKSKRNDFSFHHLHMAHLFPLRSSCDEIIIIRSASVRIHRRFPYGWWSLMCRRRGSCCYSSNDTMSLLLRWYLSCLLIVFHQSLLLQFFEFIFIITHTHGSILGRSTFTVHWFRTTTPL